MATGLTMMQRQLTIPSALLACALAGPAQAKVVREIIELPVEVVDARGETIRQPIKVAVFRDDSRPRSPFLVLNHGRSSDPARQKAVRPEQYAANARYFVAQGFAVFFPVRVGYGASGGPDVERAGPCESVVYPRVYEAAARQSIAVIDHAKTLPYVDPEGIVVGQSFGGTTAIALAAKSIPAVVAAVNIAGGGGGRPATHPAQPCGIDQLTGLFGSYGATARIPTLWLYSENDRYWGASLPRTWHAAFTGRGGNGRFVQLPAHQSDGHVVFTARPELWKPAFEAFMRSCCNGFGAAAGLPQGGARPPGTPAAFTHALAVWAAKHKVTKASIVVRRGGRIVHQAGIGGADPSAPVLLASLSKSITGACVATLVRDGRLGLDWPLSKALARHFATHAPPRDARIARVTIGQLLTHRAGFAGANDGEDIATRSVLDAYLTWYSTREAPKPDYVAMLLHAGLERDPGASFVYANAGYVVLGAVIEAATGRSYEAYCRENVLLPAGASAVLDPQWAVLWSSGGWRASGADYLAFMDQLDPARAEFGATVRDWMLDRRGKTTGAAHVPDWYGPGIRMRDSANGVELWHTGTWRRLMPPDAHGPRSAETSLLAVRLADGTSWFVHSTPVVLGGARLELYRELLTAYRSVRWD